MAVLVFSVDEAKAYLKRAAAEYAEANRVIKACIQRRRDEGAGRKCVGCGEPLLEAQSSLWWAKDAMEAARAAERKMQE